MKEKILRFLRKLFKVHSPSEDQQTEKDKRKFTKEDVKLILAYCAVIIFIGVMIFMFAHSSFAKSAEGPKPETKVVEQPVKEETQPEVAEPEVVEVEVVSVLYFDVPIDHALQDHIFAECESRNIDPAIIVAMIKKESYYNPNCIGDGGDSLGLMQIQPKWHQSRANQLGCSDLMDPYNNVTVGIDLFASLYSKGGSLEWALMAYNGGPSYANRKTRNGEVSDYARTVINTSNNLERCIEP